MTSVPSLPPLLVADDCGLDFLNSVAAPFGERIDWLGNGQGLLGWLEQAGLLPEQAALEVLANSSVASIDAVATQARDLREWFRAFINNHAGKPIPLAAFGDLDRLNRLIADGAAYRQIELRAGHANAARQGRKPPQPQMLWRRHRRWRTAQDLLVPIAEAIGDTICLANFERIKSCEGPKCTLWFNDTSKNHTRRWCMMSLCGNRAKAAAHRARSRSSQHDQ